jgi:hypothetical protein
MPDLVPPVKVNNPGIFGTVFPEQQGIQTVKPDVLQEKE